MAYLLNLKGSLPAVIELKDERVVIGRSPDCAAVLPADAVSRHHTQIIRDGHAFLIDDLGSRNGTYVNGRRVTGPIRLSDNALVTIGQYLFAFRADVPSPSDTGLPFNVIDSHESPDIISQRNAIDGSTVITTGEVQPEVKLRAILEISNSLRTAVRIETVLPRVLDTLFKILPQADYGFILLENNQTKRLEPKASRSRRYSSDQTLRLSRTIVTHVHEHGQALLLADPRDAEFPIGQSISVYAMRSIICVPLLDQNNRSMGIIHLHTEDKQHPFTHDDLELLLAVAGPAATALENAQLNEELLAQERIKRDLELAREVQRRFLPKTLPQKADYDFFAYYEAAYLVGGDYYGFVDLPGERLAISLCDVAGKGVSAALLMAHLSWQIRIAALSANSPAMTLRMIKQSLLDVGLDDKFMTLLYMILDPCNHSLCLANAAHLPPLIRFPDGTVRTLGDEITGLPLIVNIDPDYEYAMITVPLEPGTTVMLYTDGITEARDPSGELFGSARLERALHDSAGDPRSAGEAVMQAWTKFSGGQHALDDVSLICFGRKAE